MAPRIDGSRKKPTVPKQLARPRFTYSQRNHALWRMVVFILLVCAIYSFAGAQAFFNPEHFENGRTSVEFVRGFIVITIPIVIWAIYAIIKNFGEG